jgi:hypothetical protein
MAPRVIQRTAAVSPWQTTGLAPQRVRLATTRKAPQRPSCLNTSRACAPTTANPDTRARRYHDMSLEEQLEILGRLRRRIERS